jgi:vitamin B12 transporter
MRFQIAIAATVLAVNATDTVAAEDSDLLELEPIRVVTPSRMPEALDRSLAPVSVISREDIRLSAAQDLYELLRLQPGVDIVRTGGPGTQTSIFLRGTNSNHVLVLIDGVRVSSANTGAYAWEQLPLNQIERIEIVRGPRGSLYGSDSIGGVIHVFTRSRPEPYVRVTAGSYGTAEAEGGLGYEGEHTQLSLTAGYRDVDGFSAQNPAGFSYHPDDDGHHSASLGFKGSTEAGYGRWQYSLLAIDTESEFDQGVSDAEQMISAIGFRGYVSPNWDYDVRAGYVRDDLFSDFGLFTTEFESRRYDFSWQNHLDLGQGQQLSFGLDYYRENGRSAGAWDQSRNNAGVFASYDRRFERLHVQVGGRLDDNSRFGSKLTGQAAIGYDLGDRWQLIGSYGTAFRGPNLSEQYSPGFGGLFAGNPDLDPESSASGEIGLRWQHERLGRFSASLYRTDVDDLIAFNGEFFGAINVNEARLEGLELEYALVRGGWLLNAGATLQDTEDRATGMPLLRRPEEKGSFTLDRQFDNGSWVGVEWFYSGEREDFGGVTLPDYHLLNLRAGWSFTPAWRLELRGENLGDEVYEPAYGFNAAGRSWFLSLAWLP